MGEIRRKRGRIVGVTLDTDWVDDEELRAWLELEYRAGAIIGGTPPRKYLPSWWHDLQREKGAARRDRLEAIYDLAFERIVEAGGTPGRETLVDIAAWLLSEETPEHPLLKSITSHSARVYLASRSKL